MSISSLVLILIENVALLVAGAFVLLAIFPQGGLVDRDKGLLGKVWLILFFGVFGILGTYKGNAIFHSVANLRAMAVITAGLFDGPITGIGAGLIAGLHRFMIDPWGFSSLPCSLATITEGAIAGMVHNKFPSKSRDWKTGMLLTFFGEIMHMGFVLAMSRPFHEAVALVKLIALPMIIANTLGTGLFLHIINLTLAYREKDQSVQAEKIFEIARRTVGHLRDGLNFKSARATAEILYKSLPVAAVAITDTRHILAFVGQGSDHHKVGKDVMTRATKEVISTNNPVFLKSRKEIGCKDKGCPLASAIIVPLRKGEELVGTLKLYGSNKFRLNSTFFAIAKGLSALLSIQLELEDIQIKDRLLAHARIRHLQAQINPHFLFNSLNTIASFCRTKPQKARELILELSVYMRRNLDSSKGFIRLSEELEQISSYLAIEKARFGQLIHAKIEVDPECIDWPIPPLIIQPLVENAIKHGLKPKDGGGTVELTIKRLGAFMEVCVRDDGVGMDEETLSSILSSSDEDLEGGGIGLRNSNWRLQQIYGVSSGMKIKSQPGKGTTVYFAIPNKKIQGPSQKDEGHQFPA